MSLRERKKIKTRAEIRRQAMRLFAERGYADTTVEQIAEAADISPSTFFRYFPNKERVAVTDDLDPVLIAAFERQPHDIPTLEAFRRAVTEAYEVISDDDWATDIMRQRLVSSVPELRGAWANSVERSIDLLAGLAAQRLGREPGDFEIQVLAGALSGALLRTMLNDPRDLDGINRALDFLAAGLPI